MFTNLFNYKIIIPLLFLMVYSDSYTKEKTSYELFSANNDNSLMNSPEIKNNVTNARLLYINKTELRKLFEIRNPEISVKLPSDNSSERIMELERFEVLSADSKIIEKTLTGERELPRNNLTLSYKGKFKGNENSLIVLNITGDKLNAFIISETGNYNLGNLKDAAGNETDNYIFYKDTDLKIKNEFSCFTDNNISAEYAEKMRRAILHNQNDRTPTDLYIAEIAIEIDFATYNIYNQSSVAATNYALSLMASVSAVYMKEVNVRLIVPYLRVWTESDPYPGTNSNSVLTQFRSYWNANQQSVQRTLAHMISRRSGNMGGIAYLDVLCDNTSGGYGYGFSNTNGTILPLPTYSWDVMVVTHELGHNFGSPHTQNCGWVGGMIDSCYTSEGGCYTGPLIPIVGTIMSYCHLNGSISLSQGFGPQPKDLIRNHAEASSCLYVSPRDLVLAYPNGGELIRTGETREVYWGTSLTGNVNIQLSTNNGTSWQAIQNNVPASQRTFFWTVPYMASNSQAKIRILNSSNSSVGDTSDAVFTIILNLNAFTVVSPPSFTRVEVNTANSGIQDFSWKSAGTEPSIRYKIKFRKIGTNVDYSYQSNNGGRDTTASIRKSLLDSLAAMLGTTGDSVMCTWKVWGYNGVDSTASSNVFVVTLIRTSVGINVLSTSVPYDFNLYNNYPNPFNPSTRIKFDIPELTYADLKIYDLNGRLIQTLVSQNLQPGSYEYYFQGLNLASGTYLYRLTTENYSDTKRMVLIK